jgi:NAD(P)-dependent dehydrogenase (short-subunit alcohol dehydrogenase family)
VTGRLEDRAAPRRLEDRVVVVIGAGTRPSADADADAPPGNGRAIAIQAAREGASVVCVDREGHAARVTADLIGDEGGTASVLVADVSDEADCERILHVSEEPWGVVCNAGIGLGLGLAHTSADQWDATLAVNLRGPFLVARAAVPRIAPGGSIVFIGSVAGLMPGSRLPAYDASKAGLIGLCRHVALEAARRGVRANVVAPGLIDTPLGRAATEGRPARGRTPVPLGRQGSAWEVASATTFLLSAEASYITGHTLLVDGGLAIM